MSPGFAAKAAGLVHDLHRWHWPFTRRALLPLNRRVVERHLGELREAFGRRGVVFWLRDGTALGAYRERGIIPHDDDIDIGVWAKDRPGVDLVVADLERRGFVVYRRRDDLVALIKDWETVEICVSGRPVPADTYTFRLEEFFAELAPIGLFGGEFMVPRRIEAYLEFCYGADWRVPRDDPWGNSCWKTAPERERHARDFRPRV